MSNPKTRLNTYHIDPDEAHIVIKENPDHDTFMVLQRICPASLYLYDSHGYHYDYTGCLECGSCLIIGGDLVFARWEYPRDGYGVDYSE